MGGENGVQEDEIGDASHRCVLSDEPLGCVQCYGLESFTEGEVANDMQSVNVRLAQSNELG